MDQDEFLQMLLDQLPEERPGEERRRHALTRADLRIIAALIDERMQSHPCKLALGHDGTAVLSEWAEMLIGVKKWSIRGMMIIVAAILWGVINVFLKHDMWPRGWWQR